MEDIVNFLNKFSLLNELYLRVTFLNDESGFLYQKKLLESLYFPHLTTLGMDSQNL